MQDHPDLAALLESLRYEDVLDMEKRKREEEKPRPKRANVN